MLSTYLSQITAHHIGYRVTVQNSKAVKIHSLHSVPFASSLVTQCGRIYVTLCDRNVFTRGLSLMTAWVVINSRKELNMDTFLSMTAWLKRPNINPSESINFDRSLSLFVAWNEGKVSPIEGRYSSSSYRKS